MDNQRRFRAIYGLPAGRVKISKESSEHLYTVEKTLDPGRGRGQGAQNKGVYLVKNKSTGKRCVLKKIPANYEELRREILFLQVLDHPNIVGFVDAFITERSFFNKVGLFTEYCEFGTVQDLIMRYLSHNKRHTQQQQQQQQQKKQQQQQQLIPESFIWHVLHSLTSALQYVHHGILHSDHRDPPVPSEPGGWPLILHRDIKASNIFFQASPGLDARDFSYPHWPFNSETTPLRTERPSAYPRVVLADFGCATQQGEPDFCHKNLVGTPHWLPPELPEITALGEIWAIGAVSLSLCRLLPHGPISHQPPPERKLSTKKWLRSAEARKGIRDLSPDEEGYSSALAQILKQCLSYSKDKRPLSYELMSLIQVAEKKEFGEQTLELRALPRWAFVPS